MQSCVQPLLNRRQLGLEQLLVVGHCQGLQVSMLAEAFEAVLGAVCVDGGVAAVRHVYSRNWPLTRERLADVWGGAPGPD